MNSPDSNTPNRINCRAFNLVLQLLLKSDTPCISVQEAANRFDDFIFLDAREMIEYKISHLQHARYLGVNAFSTEMIQDLDKNDAIIIYCSVGKRSEDLTITLKKLGYTNVYNLYGGIFEWINQGYPVFDENNEATQKIHPYGHLWGKWLDKGVKAFH